MSTVDEIKDRLNIVDVISENVKLRRSGSSYSGFCPFHDNKRTPALAVFAETGTWHCFGCGEGGDVFSYLMKREGWDFRETLEYLAKRTGVQLEPPTPQQKEQQEVFANQRDLLEAAVLYFQNALLNTNEGAQAKTYLTERGVSDHTIQQFGLGYAPDAWDGLMNHFLNQGYDLETLQEVGLVTYNQDRGSHYDRFRNRLMFPIRDARGRMTGFGARTLDPEGIPKYLNSPQTDLFNKGNLLYGLDLARRAIRDKDQVVIVEGYLDVIVPFQAGFENIVSPMGTALSPHHLRALKNLTQNIILALDPDAAGEKATMRGLDVARETLDHEQEMVFDARGLMRYEARLQADIRVVQLPEGLDPDEIILRNPKEWQQLIDKARPIVIHVMETLASEQDITDPKIKGKIAAQVLPLIEDVANPVEREDYRQRLARLLQVDERSLISTAPPPQMRTRWSRRQSSPSQVTTSKQQLPKSDDTLPNQLEKHSLQLLLRNPEALIQLDRWLQTHHLQRLSPDDFHEIIHQRIADLIQRSLVQDEIEPDLFIENELEEDEVLQPVVARMMVEFTLGEPSPRQLMTNLIRTFTRLRLYYNTQYLSQLKFLMQEIENADNYKDFQQTLLKETVKKSRLDKAFRENIII
jgi:DNA primase